jgi:UDP-N-acetylglucosamine 2-epimerase (non-hydrolysing)
MSRPVRSPSVLTIFGTRPEVIKLAPILCELAGDPALRSIIVSTGQHADLVAPFAELFELHINRDLRLMQPGQSPSELCARALTALGPVLTEDKPDLVLVQGDTTTALAGALAAFHRRIPVGHVEAGLRTDDGFNPFPEEMNRRLISRLASFHFAATRRNADNLAAEGVPGDRVFLTGNPVVDALQTILDRQTVSPTLDPVLKATEGCRRVALTTHRRESFGSVLEENLTVLREFVAANEDVVLIFPVHPNPSVRGPAGDILGGVPRVHLLPPLDYRDFIGLLARSWLIVSDSGGVQEEAPTLGVPLLVLRKNTERPEAVECGCARMAPDAGTLRNLLEAAYREGPGGRKVANPFGQGDAGQRIAALVRQIVTESPGVGVSC